MVQHSNVYILFRLLDERQGTAEEWCILQRIEFFYLLVLVLTWFYFISIEYRKQPHCRDTKKRVRVNLALQSEIAIALQHEH